MQVFIGILLLMPIFAIVQAGQRDWVGFWLLAGSWLVLYPLFAWLGHRSGKVRLMVSIGAAIAVPGGVAFMVVSHN